MEVIEDFVIQKPEKMIYHYTNAAGLIGILRSKKIWATSHLHLNDRSEFKTAVTLLGNHVRRSSLSESQRRFFVKLVSEQQDTRFVMSFSEHHDRLSQWRAYGTPEGYALGFSQSNPIFSSAESQRFGLVKCLYERSTQDHFCDILITEFRELIKSTSVIKDFDAEQQLHSFFERYQWNYITALICASFKSKGFREEGEWRLVSQFPRDLTPKLEYRSGRFGVTPYYELPLSTQEGAGLIDRVVIGPSANRFTAKESLMRALATYGFSGTQITVSKTPLR